MHSPKLTSKVKNIRYIYGGTFDPPHYGHLSPLQDAMDKLDISHVELMPTFVSALKSNVSHHRHRLAMLDMLIQEDPRLSINKLELELAKPSFTVNTLLQLKENEPNTHFVFIIGSDSLQNIHKWKQWQTIFSLASVLVLHREFEQNTKTSAQTKPTNTALASNLNDIFLTQCELDKLIGTKMDEQCQQFLSMRLAQTNEKKQCIKSASFKDIIASSVSGKLFLVKNRGLALSSSFLREQIAVGASVNAWLPDNINAYIKANNLYKQSI
ncbi:nicotinate (nicotinamide) nucleotide adenylyltransferase [Glaciecola petra]|uniref:Probable nicotinate-nucleotide adenylyltransferase n=1 Tax=Glaciecola petra TaxID=3075602 RepID=A0ABU2ZPF4_9ALTE|nr:nicotinate (nicotinamide) nucleotide adenylyltransferase [Aestuariibacter sp. P117]MDT0594513.1 nicotinate (nicotinamide) nucleotide adenylyltransferase [Aestuariibacter sp. P117]